MKVTALIPDDLINEVKELSGGKNITEALMISLTEWRAIKRVKALNEEIKKTPLAFRAKFKAENVRKLNRR